MQDFFTMESISSGLNTAAVIATGAGFYKLLNWLWLKNSIKQKSKAEAKSADADANSKVIENYDKLIAQMTEFQESRDESRQQVIENIKEDLEKLKEKVKILTELIGVQNETIDKLKEKISFKNHVINQAHYCDAYKKIDGHTCKVIDALQSGIARAPYTIKDKNKE